MFLKNNLVSCILLLVIFYLCNCEKIRVKEPDTSDLTRPCATKDMKCIRKQFQKRGWCSRRKSHKYKNEKFIVSEIEVEMSYFNVTDVTENVQFSGLQKGKVLEFYINKKNGKSVLTVDFTDLDIVGDAKLYYHRPEKEDLIITTVTTEHYGNVITNTILPKGRNGLSQSETYSRVPELPKYDLGEGIKEIHNQEAQDLFAAFNAHPESAVRDLLLHRGPIMARFYIDYIICAGDDNNNQC